MSDHKEIPTPEVGMPATIHWYTDSTPCTVIKVSGSKKTIWLQEDDAKLLNAEELEFHPGGFAAHCSNQSVQRYEYTRNPNGGVYKATLRKNGHYVRCGSNANRRDVTLGTRFKYYDYNF
jgi:hypothetical protein